LSERDFVRKKNKWLPKIKAWIDENNPGDQLIPFSVALEERLVNMSDEEKIAEAETLGMAKGNPSALGKITTAGYASLELIRYFTCESGTRSWVEADLQAGRMRCEHGRSGRVSKPPPLPVSSSQSCLSSFPLELY
jgi:ribosome-binding ATPase YchF (GTP1/OBG family)